MSELPMTNKTIHVPDPMDFYIQQEAQAINVLNLIQIASVEEQSLLHVHTMVEAAGSALDNIERMRVAVELMNDSTNGSATAGTAESL